MILFAETIETDRYSYDRTEHGVPVFVHGKNVHHRSGPVPPSAECGRCHTAWTLTGGTCQLHWPGRGIASSVVHTRRELLDLRCRRPVIGDGTGEESRKCPVLRLTWAEEESPRSSSGCGTRRVRSAGRSTRPKFKDHKPSTRLPEAPL